ncbi:hypothetical protein A1OE_67 [Candidatus Endolissoclinum faulkneri L2]|uniref:YlxR domain-containing protein n=2 Tax=Candidatus Endolissoclinum faulkneri TaxID=1263979 RepID=K7ZC43_9PROT|nr:hypothetical protein A1OE_67 [Candidatus Endolissoclinum faulkneri L2]
MVRFVVGNDNFILPDIEERLPGRGLWIFADRETISCAVEKRLFTWAAKQPVKVDSKLIDIVESLLKRRCLDTLSLARRLSLTITDNIKVRHIMETGAPGLLLEAVESTECAKAHLRSIVGSRSVISCLTKADFIKIFGRQDVLYTFVKSTSPINCLANKLLRDATRLNGVCLKKV